MYIDYFGLKDYPFRITPDTEYLYMSSAHSRAKAYMEYAIFNREGFVVITGEIGAGKTTLIKKLLLELDENIIVAKIFQTQLDEVELLQAILVEFGLNPFSAKKVELLNMLNQFLVESYLEGKQVLLIIDDAQNLSKRVLEEVTMLSSVETQKEKILHVILVGQPELNQKLEAPDMEQLLQRVSLRYHVRTLSRDETKEYVEHRLKVAGINSMLFSDDTYASMYEYSGGVPRLINTLCDTALTCAFADSHKLVDKDEFDGAIKELQWQKYDERYEAAAKANYAQADNLYEEDSLQASDSGGSADARDALQGAYGPIASRALVEISRQLKRIADSLDDSGK
jgi:general secretion pathway protein A